MGLQKSSGFNSAQLVIGGRDGALEGRSLGNQAKAAKLSERSGKREAKELAVQTLTTGTLRCFGFVFASTEFDPLATGRPQDVRSKNRRPVLDSISYISCPVRVMEASVPTPLL